MKRMDGPENVNVIRHSKEGGMESVKELPGASLNVREGRGWGAQVHPLVLFFQGKVMPLLQHSVSCLPSPGSLPGSKFRDLGL
jgi:hypothetical protein